MILGGNYMGRKIIGIIISFIVAYMMTFTLGSEAVFGYAFIASLLICIYFEMPNKK